MIKYDSDGLMDGVFHDRYALERSGFVVARQSDEGAGAGHLHFPEAAQRRGQVAHGRSEAWLRLLRRDVSIETSDAKPTEPPHLLLLVGRLLLRRLNLTPALPGSVGGTALPAEVPHPFETLDRR